MAEKTVPTPRTRNRQESQAAAASHDREPTRAEEVFVAPPVDIYEDADTLVVLADLPGVAPEALDLRVEQRLLTITVEQRLLTITAHVQPAPSGTPLHCEYELSGFFRQFQLPPEVDTARIEAVLKQGVLKLKLPRSADQQPRRIEVRSG
jgi:HSP20 family molecular chaperone IbpA